MCLNFFLFFTFLQLFYLKLQAVTGKYKSLYGSGNCHTKLIRLDFTQTYVSEVYKQSVILVGNGKNEVAGYWNELLYITAEFWRDVVC